MSNDNVCKLESVVTTIGKLSEGEFGSRHLTGMDSSKMRIQLDVQLLRTASKETVEAAVGFLLDEMIVAAAECCLNPIPLEVAISDQLVQAKLAKTSEERPASSSRQR